MPHFLVVIVAAALLLALVFCSQRQAEAGTFGKPDPVQNGSERRIQIIANGQTIIFELNDSQAARDLVAQLPLDIDVENYGSNEKIVSPPRKLNTTGTALAKNVRPGTLCYYAPWANVVMFYGSFGSAPGLYELGRAVQGGEHIRALSGGLRIETVTPE